MNGEMLMTLLGGLVALAVLAGLLWLLWHILQQQGRLVLRIEAVESRLGQAGLASVTVQEAGEGRHGLVASPVGLPMLPTLPSAAAASQRNGPGAPAVPRPPTGLKIGETAPDFSLPDLSGNLVSVVLPVYNGERYIRMPSQRRNVWRVFC